MCVNRIPTARDYISMKVPNPVRRPALSHGQNRLKKGVAFSGEIVPYCSGSNAVVGRWSWLARIGRGACFSGRRALSGKGCAVVGFAEAEHPLPNALQFHRRPW
jgi:hypothetical protein